MEKKLYRSKTDRMVAGVCGGLANYLDMDSTVIRVIWAIIFVCTGLVPGLIIYIFASFIIPEEGQPASGS